MRLSQALVRAVQQGPDTVAMICDGRRTTYAQLQERVARLAGGLRRLGVHEGHTVALLGAGSDRQFECQLAISWAGAVATVPDTTLDITGVGRQLAECETVAACVDDAYAPHIDALLEVCPYLRILVFCGNGPCPAEAIGLASLLEDNEPIPAADSADDAAYGLFPVPETGAAVELSHRNIFSTALALRAEGPFRQRCVVLQGLPLSDPLGAVTTACVLLAGGTQLLPAGGSGLKRLLASHGITDLVLTPGQLAALADDHADAVAVAPARHLLCPATDDAVRLLQAARAALPAATVLLIDGPPEATGFATVLTLAADAPLGSHPLSRGRSGAHVQLRIVDGEGRDVPRGTPGEIWLQGDNLMRGYFNRPELSAVALRNGGLHTGASGWLDAEGQLHRQARRASASRAAEAERPETTPLATLSGPADESNQRHTRL